MEQVGHLSPFNVIHSYLGLFQGSFRCDVNVSVNKNGQPHGTRCEIKNLNSVKFMMIAIS
jgi:Asp-tRNA(Asn)/Glu-tRNA(Gln) amidotransferase B subunit